MQYLWSRLFFKIDSTFFPVGKSSVLIVLQARFYRQCTAVAFLLIFRLDTDIRL